MSPEQNSQDGDKLNLRKFPAGTHTRAFGPRHKASFNGIGYRLGMAVRSGGRVTGRVGGDPALWPPLKRVRAPVTRMRVQGGCVDVDVAVGGDGVVLVVGQELLCIGSVFWYGGDRAVETESFKLNRQC